MAVSEEEELQYKLCTTYQKLHELRFFLREKKKMSSISYVCTEFYQALQIRNICQTWIILLFEFFGKRPSCFISVKVDISLLDLQGLMYLYKIINII